MRVLWMVLRNQATLNILIQFLFVPPLSKRVFLPEQLLRCQNQVKSVSWNHINRLRSNIGGNKRRQESSCCWNICTGKILYYDRSMSRYGSNHYTWNGEAARCGITFFWRGRTGDVWTLSVPQLPLVAEQTRRTVQKQYREIVFSQQGGVLQLAAKLNSGLPHVSRHRSQV